MSRRTLKKTSPLMRGDDVKEFQTLVTKHGFNCGTIDSLYGNNCVSACKAFQRSKGLISDGVCGQKTWEALLALPNKEGYIELLIAWGFEDSLNSIGEKETVKQFQAAMGLSVDGIVGKNTLAALNGEVILPRIKEQHIKCQCGVHKEDAYCNGYPRGLGAGAGVLLLAERIFREVEKTYPNTTFYVSSYKTPAYGGGVAGGYRCSRWNMERGGSSKSQHKSCFALDIFGTNPDVEHYKIRDKIEAVALSMNTKGGVGYGAKNAGIVHIDTRGVKARWAY